MVVCRTRKADERQGKVLVVNAVNDYSREQAQSFLREPHIEKVLETYRLFEDVPGFARVVSLEEIEAMARAIASALDYAHKHGVVHRDLKPANMILGPAGLKIVDFGIARITRGDDEATTIGRMLGPTGPNRNGRTSAAPPSWPFLRKK